MAGKGYGFFVFRTNDFTLLISGSFSIRIFVAD